MTESKTTPTTHFPYPPGFHPSKVFWPPKKPAPHSRDAYFTNADPRLRPQEIIGPQLYFSDIQKGKLVETETMVVTPNQFPQLHALFQTLSHKAGITGYTLMLHRNNVKGGYSSMSQHVIGIDLKQINSNDFDSLQAIIGHELGHVWQGAHWNTEQVIIRGDAFNDTHRYEVEADIFARCLSGDSASILRGLKITLGNAPDFKSHPSAARRIHAVAASMDEDCAVFNLPNFVKPVGFSRTSAHK